MPFDRRAFESEIGMHRMGSAGNGGIRKVLYAFSTSRKMPQMLEANRSWVSTEQALDKGGDWQMGNDDDCSADK